ncbi:hypothetical protein B0H13DRAFT_2343188 [Mycena leptocephala]|nr:hypothetical protein B0H13DRAFT_2366937 [Mycena leptocephala]KAJ7885607.1 hypothetical protein B0H13DRAFT_2343188 [Mycena leptocephala]
MHKKPHAAVRLLRNLSISFLVILSDATCDSGMFFSVLLFRLPLIWVLLIAGSVTALPIISNFETPHRLGDGSRSLLTTLGAGVVSYEAITDVAGKVVAPIAGGTVVLICLLLFFCCFRQRKSPKFEDMGTNNPAPVAERPPWAT